jgi:cell division protein FtsX
VAAVIRHTVAEGILLLRQRLLISFILAAALAVPICLAGLTMSFSRWLGPVVEQAREGTTVAVLLHPNMDGAQRARWLDDHASANPDWVIETVPPEDLIERLTHWFPYLRDLFRDDARALVPPMVEITTDDAESLDGLASSPAVIAVGPRSNLQRRLAEVAAQLELVLGLIAVILLLAASLLAGVWVHLELFRHADEITIMRLVGATEATVRGPFVLAVAIPGALAGLLSMAGTIALGASASNLVVTLGLPPVTVLPSLLVGQLLLAALLPVVAAALTLTRHARHEFEG